MERPDGEKLLQESRDIILAISSNINRFIVII